MVENDYGSSISFSESVGFEPDSCKCKLNLFLCFQKTILDFEITNSII